MEAKELIQLEICRNVSPVKLSLDNISNFNQTFFFLKLMSFFMSSYIINIECVLLCCAVLYIQWYLSTATLETGGKRR